MVLTKTATKVVIELITLTESKTYDPSPEFLIHVEGTIEFVDQLSRITQEPLRKVIKVIKVNELPDKLKTNCEAFDAGIKALVTKELGL